MEELDLKELFQIFWDKKVYIILITLIFLVLGVIYTIALVTPKYRSSTTLILTKSESSATTSTEESITQTDITLNQKLISTYRELIKSDNVLRTVITNLNLSDTNEEMLKKAITVTAVEDTEVIKISVSDENPRQAASLANEIGKVFAEKVAEIYKINNVYVVDQAEEETEPYNINHIKDVMIFVLLGLVVSVMYALLSNILDTTIKSEEDITKNLNLPVIALLPLCEFESKGGRK